MHRETIRGLLMAAAETRGVAPAILSPGRAPLSFEGLLSQIEGIACDLRRAGIRRSDRVAVVLPNGPDLATACLGISSAAGCAPLNPSLTSTQFEFYLRDLGAAALLLAESDDSPARHAADLVGIPTFVLRPGARAGEFRLTPDDTTGDVDWLEPEDPCLLLHTSGTTSRPKLVPLTGRNLAASAAHIAAALRLSPADRCVNIMPLFHVHGLIAGLLASLQAGGSVVCTSGLYAAHFFSWVAEYRPTWYTAVPTMHQAIVAQARANPDRARHACFRFIRSSSAALPVTVLEDLERLFGAPVIEAYGMTEAAHQMASNPLPPDVRKPGSVGRAAGPEIAIMEADGALLPGGTVGEVVIRGPNVTSGYQGDASATQAAFADGWFRTGDQGRLDEDGYLFLTGRLKELINRGGEKIAPREIDELLLTHPDVRQAVCFAVPHLQLGEDVGAAVELHAGSALDCEELRRWAAARLPAFKVPRVVRIVDRIPTGPTGKLQRSGLAERLGVQVLDDARRAPETVPPGTPLEARIARVWQELLPGVPFGVHDRFEALGGDSLLAATMLTAVAASEGVNVGAARFVAEGTIAALAADVMASEKDDGEALVPLRREGAAAPLYCIPGHEGGLLGVTLLAHALRRECPVWGFDLRKMPEAGSIEEQAAACVAALRARDAGPYRLVGSCFGGLVAFEMARQIAVSGGCVQFLALVDTLYPAWRARTTPLGAVRAYAAQAALKIYGHSRALKRVPLGESLTYVTTRVRAFVKNHRQTTAARMGLDAGLGARNRGLAWRYAGGPYAGPLLVVRVPGRRPQVPALGWSSAAKGPLEMVSLPFGFEGAMSERNLPALADAIRARLPLESTQTVDAM